MSKFWRYMLITLAIGLALCFVSCCTSQRTAERKIARIIKCNPQLAKADSVTVKDTIYIDSVTFSSDTVITHDTLRIERDGARVTIVRRDTFTKEIPVYVEVECPPDTVYFEKTVPVKDRIVVNAKYNKNIIYLILVFVIIIILYLLGKKIQL